MIRPPPANAEDFNLVRPCFGSVFILGGFHKLTPKRFYLSLSTTKFEEGGPVAANRRNRIPACLLLLTKASAADADDNEEGWGPTIQVR